MSSVPASLPSPETPRMLSRRPLYGVTAGLVLLLCPALRAAQVRTQNFLVDAPDYQTAQEFGHMAEPYRKQAVNLRRLLTLKEYHEAPDVMVIYAEGYSVSQYLVNQGGRQAFLGFVALGMREGWDKAVQTYYHMQSVEGLEQAWLQHLRD